MSTWVNAKKSARLRDAAMKEFGHGFVRPVGNREFERDPAGGEFSQEWEEIPQEDRGYASTFDQTDDRETHREKAVAYFGHTNFRLVTIGHTGKVEKERGMAPTEFFFIWESSAE